MENKESHLLDHPDLQPYFYKLVPSLIAESDRGAFMLGVSQIDEHLNILYKKLVPDCISGKRQKEIFNHTGPFGSLASKLDVALVCRLLSPELVDAVHGMRKIRNDLAHKTDSFSLKEHRNRLYEIFSMLGSGVDIGINRVAIEGMMSNLLYTLTETEHPTDVGKPLFEGREEAIEYLSKNGEVLRVLDDKVPRWELAIGVGVICGIILLHRDKAMSGLGNNKTLFSILSSIEPDKNSLIENQ